MRVLAFCLAMLVSQSSIGSVYIVQSKYLSSIYNTSIGHALKHLRPNEDIRILSVRDFNRDVYTTSKQVTEETIRNKAAKYDNLVLLGHDVSLIRSQGKASIYIPILLDQIETGIMGPASPSSILRGIADARNFTQLMGRHVYILSDPSSISRLRLSLFLAELREDKDVIVTSKMLESVSDLRNTLRSLNKEPQGTIINNVFNLVDEDDFRDVPMQVADEIISNINTRHVEVSILKPGLQTAMGFGALPAKIAILVDALLQDGSYPIDLGMQTGVNLSRVTTLHITDYVVGNSKSIVTIEVVE